ncbi:Uncharacterised protein [Peptoniphilus harei]|uniref:Uncharacterized protein n=1 Tax=Peptoniphilus harei TaxID=54005 RepID=A0A2X1XKV2_9FIRM|nr:hypothetical protein [Peptoniphilus harei]SPY43679.1 Uncharacterised protein [Peptoniphilus harei]
MIGIIGATGDIGSECTKILNGYGIKDIKLDIEEKKKFIRVRILLHL